MASKTQFVKKNEGPTPVFQCKTKRNRNSTKSKVFQNQTKNGMILSHHYFEFGIQLKKHATISTSPFPMGGIPMFRSMIYKDHFRTKILQLHSQKTRISPENWWLNPLNFGKKPIFRSYLTIFVTHSCIYSNLANFPEIPVPVLDFSPGTVDGQHPAQLWDLWNIHINCIKLCICIIYNIIFILVFSIMSIMFEVPSNPTAPYKNAVTQWHTSNILQYLIQIHLIYVFNNHHFQNHPAFSPYLSQAPSIKAWKDGQNDQRCHEERPRDQLMMPGQPGGTILI